MDPSSLRSIERVPLVELLASLLRLGIEEGDPMPERDLYEHALRSIGLEKLGKRIRLRCEGTLAQAVDSGWLTATDVVARDAPG